MKKIIKLMLVIPAIALLLTACISEKDSLILLGRDYGANKEITDGKYDKSMAVKCHNGIFVGEKLKDLASWRGIPFAKAPVGELRFKAPVAPDASNKVYEAYNYGKMPWGQTSKSDETDTDSEYCLELKIVTGKNDIKNKPVMVFVHGGGFTLGSASSEFVGEWFSSIHPEVILVTIEYRLNIFGFTNFDDVPGGEAFAGAQNNGLKDQIMALKWVNENIAGFGGDPKNITLFGESAGSVSAALLMVCDEAKGLFNKTILESGSPAYALKDGQTKPAATAMLNELGAKNMEDLQNAPIENIIDHMFDIMNVYYFYGPVLDGDLLPLDPNQEYLNGKCKDIKVLVGYNEEENRHYIERLKVDDEVGTERAFHRWIQSRYEHLMNYMGDDEESKSVANNYIAQCKKAGETDDFAIESLMTELSFGIGTRNMADLQCEHNDTYLYYFAYPSFGAFKGAAHGAEEFPLFNIDVPKEDQVGDYNALVKQIGEVWISFASTGVPTLNGKPIAKYDLDKQNVIVFDKDGKVFTQENYLTERHNALKPLLKYEHFTMVDNFFCSTDEWKIYLKI